MEETNQKRSQHRILDPYLSDRLKVSNIHTVQWEISGNPQGKPVLILHGGPGAGMDRFYRGFFNPDLYKIVQFDQRGSGNSTPFACLEENTTWDLVNDIEKLREHLDIPRWHTVFGGSWGSTLSLAYAQSHPKRVGHLILRGICLLRKSEVDFFYQSGTRWLFPEYHAQLRDTLPVVEQGHLLQNFYRRLTGDNEEEKLRAAKAWTTWEMATSKLFINEENLKKGEDERLAVAFARIETHYFVNGGFLKHENQLLDECEKIAHIPAVLINGRYDVICPVRNAYELKKRWEKAELIIVPDAGHSCTEPGIIHELVTATDKFSINP